MPRKPKGTLIIIGGHEDKMDEQMILKEVARHADANHGRLAIVTVASQKPEELAAEYTEVFNKLGVAHIDWLDIRTREEAHEEEKLRILEESPVVFFTGGDQLRITSQIGDSPLFSYMHDIFQKGGTIVGTSAGAAAMPETMLVSGPGDESHAIDTLGMAPGLGFLSGVVIDSHFAERGRIGRLLGAVAQNPRNLGLGIDENTAIVVKDNEMFQVLGSGAVYVLDGKTISFSSLSEEQSGVVSIYDVCMHVLSQGDRFKLQERKPVYERLLQEQER